MKYTILVSQKRAKELGISEVVDIIDLAVFDLFVSMLASPNVKREMDGGTPYILFNHKLASGQLPMAGMNHRNTFRRRMKKLAVAGLIIPHPDNQRRAKSLYGPGPLFDAYNLPQPAPDEVHPLHKKMCTPCTKKCAPPAQKNVHNKAIMDKANLYKEKGLPKKESSILAKSVVFNSLNAERKKIAFAWLIWRAKELGVGFKTLRGLEAQLKHFKDTPLHVLKKAVKTVMDKEWRGIEYGIKEVQKNNSRLPFLNGHEEKIVHRRPKRNTPAGNDPISELAKRKKI